MRTGRRFFTLALAALAFAHLSAIVALAAEQLTVGSKRFTESYILGEIIARVDGRTACDGHAPPGAGQHRHRLRGAQDRRHRPLPRIHRHPRARGVETPVLTRRLADMRVGPRAPMGLGVAVPLGFHNGYALAMRRDEAERRKIASLTDLKLNHGPETRPLARVPRPCGWLARDWPHVTACTAQTGGHRPRPLLRRAGQAQHRCHRHLHHRREDRHAKAWWR